MTDQFVSHLFWLIPTIIGGAAFIWLLTRWIVNIGPTQIGIVERQYIGKKLPTGRAFATGSEVGIQADYLTPGLHFVPWPIKKVVKKVDFVTIGSDELGVVTAADGEGMSAGRIYAEDKAGEHHDNFQNPVAFLQQGGVRGKQLRFLTNGTFKVHPGLFQVAKIRKTVVPEGKVGLVTAMDGAALEPGQLLGRSVQGHDNFQKAEMFLKNSGQKGPQTDFLRPGTYNIHTDVFKVEIVDAIQIGETEVGIVEAKDGKPMDRNDVVAATPDVTLHNSFQDGQAFLDNGGKRGPQEAVLRPGTYYINRYLFSVSTRAQTVIEQGKVGVLISNIGKDPAELLKDEDKPGQAPVSATATDPEDSRLDNGNRQRHVVPAGYRGIQKDVLGPGKYNINPLAYTVVIMPTTNRSVEWTADKVGRDNSRFDPFAVVSHDGFEMQVEIGCQYRILPENAPYVVQKLGSIAELEANVIHPQIDGIVRAQVSKSPAIAYQQNRAEEQSAAELAVRQDLAKYKVEIVSVMIRNIVLPEALMKTTQQKNLAQQEQSMFDAKREAELRRVEFQKTKAEADQQDSLMKAQIGIKIAEHEARQAEERAKGEAARIRTTAEATADQIEKVGAAEAGVIKSKGEAQGEAYRQQVQALTPEGVAAVEVMKLVTAAGLRITPDVQVVGGGQGGDGNGLVQLLLANMVKQTLNDGAHAAVAPTRPAATDGDGKADGTEADGRK